MGRLGHVRGRGPLRSGRAGPDPARLLQRHTMSDVDDDGYMAAMEEVANDVHASFDLGHGPLLKAVMFMVGVDRKKYLFLAAHHAVVDGVFWRISSPWRWPSTAAT